MTGEGRPPDPGSPFPWLRAAWQPLAYVALGTYFCLPLFAQPGNLGIADWDYFFHQHAVVLKSMWAYGQLPLWNPWACGGNVLWQNPQMAVLSPVYLLAPVFALPLAMKINVLLHYLVGLAGMHLLVTRVFRLRFFPLAFFVVALFTLAGGEALHLTSGHVSFLPYFYLPLQLFLYLRARETGSLRYGVGAGALVALAIYNGGIYIVAMSAVGFGVLAAALTLTTRSWKPLLLVLVMGVAAGLFSAPKLLPSVLLLGDPSFFDARNMFVPAPLTPALLVRSFMDPFLPLQAKLPGQAYGWHEYGNHLGGFGVVLVLASVTWVLLPPWRSSKAMGVSLVVTSFALFLLLLGEIGPAAPAEWLKALPIFAGLRPPVRFTLVFTLFAAALVAWVAGSCLERTTLGPGARRFLGAVFVIAALLLAFQNRAILAVAFSIPGGDGTAARSFPRTSERLMDVATDPYARNSPMYRAFVNERAVWNCYEPLQVKPVADPHRPVVYAGGPDTIIHRTWFTPNRVAFAVTTPTPGGRVYLNQNYALGWKSSAGVVRLDPETGRAYVTIDP
ncbi:MAG TPA: hypothetical protein VK911_04125, partial [Vicinamibacterales bacterium]|nr:hypothetical protein [Vicinamibacterales bacterium]